MYWCIEPRAVRLSAAAGGAVAALLYAIAALLRAPGALAAEAAGAALPCDEPPLCYTASRLEAQRNHIVLYDIDIVDRTRGISRITADRAEASGPNLGDGDVVLTGNVRLRVPQGELAADRATVQFADKRIASMTADGNPATFEHTLESAARVAHGHAREITYDLARDELQLRGDSWLSDGCNEINSEHILYDIASQRVQADNAALNAGRVHGTIRSRTGAPCAAAAERP